MFIMPVTIFFLNNEVRISNGPFINYERMILAIFDPPYPHVRVRKIFKTPPPYSHVRFNFGFQHNKIIFYTIHFLCSLKVPERYEKCLRVSFSVKGKPYLHLLVEERAIGINAGNRVDSVQDKDYWRALVNAALDLRVS